MEAHHIEGPWHQGEGQAQVIIYSANGHAIADTKTYHGYHSREHAKANARRIVACVNACANVSTELLEESPDLASAFLSADNARLIIQRNELLTALETVMEKLREDATDPMDPFAYDAEWEGVALKADRAIAIGKAA